jgi:hypothetical protein
MRILIAGILGAIAMFVWMSIAHLATPLATIGFSQVHHEDQLMSAMRSAVDNKQGLFFYPWMNPKDPNAMKAQAEKLKTEPHGLLIYNPAGADMSPGMLIAEFVKEAAISLISAFLLAQAMLAGYFARVGFVALIGLAAALTTNVSYLVWYGFPASYTLAYGFIDFFGYVVAGLVIAAILRPKMA